MGHDFIRHELMAFAAAARSLMAIMLGHEPLPTVGGKTPTGGFGINLGRTVAQGTADFRWTGFMSTGTAAAQGTGDNRWTTFKNAAGEEIITALRAHITNMPSGLRISFWIDAQGRVTRLIIDRSCGDQRIDDIAENQVRFLQFMRPPSDMKMPLTLSVIIAPGAWLYSLDGGTP